MPGLGVEIAVDRGGALCPAEDWRAAKGLSRAKAQSPYRRLPPWATPHFQGRLGHKT
jgi:hypothetical protein